MKLYHRTFKAKQIVKHGFKDGKGYYLTHYLWKGIWFSNISCFAGLDSGQAANGDTLLEMQIPFNIIRKYEWKEENKPYREFMIPAKLANKYGPPRIVED